MQLAEDARAVDSTSLAPLLSGLTSGDAGLRAIAIRALGRMESPALVPRLLRSLSDAQSEVRSEAAFAIAQSLSNAARLAAARNGPTLVAAAFEGLAAQARVDSSAQARATAVRSLVRLPLTGAEQLQVSASLAVALAREASDSVLIQAMLALEAHTRLRLRAAPVSDGTADLLREVALRSAAPAQARRLALMALNTAGRADATLLTRTLGDSDEQVRRLTAAAVANNAALDQRGRMMNLLIGDSSQLVRVEMARGWLRRGSATECAPLVSAVNGSNIPVAIAAIDALAQVERCPEADRPSVEALLRRGATRLAAGAASRRDVHIGSHSLVALARVNAADAARVVQSAAAQPSWVARAYAARTAAALRDSATLLRLAYDSVANVRTAAIEGLTRVVAHAADSIYVTALRHSDHNLLMVAAAALDGSPSGPRAVRELLGALTRTTALGKETSRDARIALLTRIGALGTAGDSAALIPFLRDFDPAVAARAAQILSRWTGREMVVAAQPRPPADPAPIDAAIRAGTRLRFTMSAAAGAGVFEVELLSEIAPFTAQRLIRLARSGYYNGLTFHRVVPNFVIQGGSPGANEYVGDGPFMRDEVWLYSHDRGTVGISTRGRDTGDAQLFVNTVDNPRLDFDYTVAARVISGMGVVDGLLEGDAIQRVEVLPPR
jgi:cyclophilin family peptidyl-prolyl cis-trans isomerase